MLMLYSCEGLILLAIMMMLFALYSLRRHLQLSYRILLALLMSVALGITMQLLKDICVFAIAGDVLKFIGHAYLALLKMLVIPLILTSIIHVIVNIGLDQNASLKKLSLLTCVTLLTLTAISSFIGLMVGYYFKVGEGMKIPDLIITPTHPYHGLTDTLLGMLPANPVNIMAQENTVAVMIFAILFGVAARMLDSHDRDKMETFKQLIATLFAIVKKLATLILSTTPYGIFALLTLLVFDQGMAVAHGLINFGCAMYTAMVIVIAMHLFIVIAIRVNPIVYFKYAYMPLLVAFTTRSSFGTLPVTEETLQRKFKTKQIVATFVPSIGATMGMNACAGIFPAMLVMAALTIMHQPLTGQLIVFVMFINAIASLGISGIPGTAYIAASVTLTSLNLPYGIIALIQGIDPIIDMGRTATNINGVLTTALLVNKSTKIG